MNDDRMNYLLTVSGMDQKNISDQEKFIQSSYQEPIKEKKTVEPFQAVNNAIIRGLSEGIIGFGQMLSGRGYPGENEAADLQRKRLKEEYLPIGESFTPKAVERGLEIGIPMLANPSESLKPIETLTRSLIGGASGEAAKGMGFGPTGQAVAENIPLIAPNLTKRITPRTSEEKALIDYARKNGMTEDELILALNRRGPIRDFLEGISSKGGRTVKAFDNTRAALGRMWNTLSASPEAQIPMSGKTAADLIQGMSKKLAKMPAESRKIIQQDFNDFLSTQMTGSDAINFWQDLNYYIAKGDRNLGILKEDIKSAMKSLSPILSEDFQMTNKLYGNYIKMAERMGPDIAEALIKQGERGIMMSAVLTGNYPLLNKILKPVAARQIATEMIKNPRFQDLGRKFHKAIRDNNIGLAKSVYDDYLIVLGEKNPEAAIQMSGVDIEAFMRAVSENKEED